MNFEDICRRIDWSSMAEQKKVISMMAKDQEDIVMNMHNDRQIRIKVGMKAKALHKMINFIEQLQDTAVAEYGVNESDVYPILKTVRLVMASKKNKN